MCGLSIAHVVALLPVLCAYDLDGWFNFEIKEPIFFSMIFLVKFIELIKNLVLMDNKFYFHKE